MYVRTYVYPHTYIGLSWGLVDLRLLLCHMANKKKFVITPSLFDISIPNFQHIKLIVYDWIRKHTHTFYILARECVSQMFATLSGWRENSFMKITQVLANISRRLLHSFKDRKTNSSHMIFSVFVRNRLLPSVFKMQKKEVEW